MASTPRYGEIVGSLGTPHRGSASPARLQKVYFGGARGQKGWFCLDGELEKIRESRCQAAGNRDQHRAVTIVPVKILLRLAFREGYLLKSDYEADSENITEVRLQKGRTAWSRKVFDLSVPRLPMHHSRPLALKKEKVRDLHYLLDLMPVNKQTFYNNIIDAHTVGLTKDVPPDEDPDDLDELLEYE
ncbi:hypothetical protein GWK47_009512 [Chionoecetes opilio]|uniref:Uncharacterized protein n=1 Tax=Chionoecetes opilio TaxID=41210 RepID=A0A8J4XXN0_CHIOP|nr:hypothetical protein GWK47_009512 [Chionoecetes opilio]